MRGAEAYINLSSLTHNLKQIRSMVGQSKILAMIKSDGYGHGAVRVAQSLSGADGFGVAALDEAIMLRHAGIIQPIIVMSQFTHIKELALAHEFNIGLVVHHESQLQILEKFKPKMSLESYQSERCLLIWLKVDTGMHRLGFLPEQVHGVWQRLQAISYIKKPVVLMTHLANADLKDDVFTRDQINTFEKAIVNLPGERSIANSAGILHYSSLMHQHWVRPGLILYGVSPFSDSLASDLNLIPAMTLRSNLMAIRQLQIGDRIGYGGCYQCCEPTLVGVVKIGYGDGYPVTAKNGTPVLVNNISCPIIGRVSMDMLTVNLNVCPDPKIGDPVILWGEGLPIEQIAACSNVIPYELLCRMGERIRFIEIN